MKTSIWIALAPTLVIAALAVAQPEAVPKSAPPPPESQLDFWVGDWDLTYRLRKTPGQDDWMEGRCRNSIEKVLGGKVIVERFDDTQPGSTGLAGMSVSVLDAATKTWRQTWVDNQSSYLDLVGKHEDGKMYFTMEKTVGGKKQISRMVFDKIEKDRFDWTWMSSADEGKTWVDNWLIHYERRKS